MLDFTSHIRPEALDDALDVTHLQNEVLGAGRFTLVAERMRRDKMFRRDLSWLAETPEAGLLGSIRFNTITVGGSRALLLGPLIVRAAFKGQGYGRALVRKALDHIAEQESSYVILVGDHPYYARFGFKVVEAGSVTFPGPVNPSRILIREVGRVGYGEPSGPVVMV